MTHIVAPLFANRTSSNDIVGFNLQNGGAAALPATYVTFGQEFAAGAMTSTSTLIATINGVSESVQVDPKAFYPDGSIQMAVLTLQQPALAAGSTLKGMLSISPAQAATALVDPVSTLAGHSLTVALSFQDGTESQIDLAAALKAALAAGTASTWLSGPLAVQFSVSVPISSSFRLLATATAYANGTFSTTIGFNNDIAMSPSGGAVTYSASIVQDGVTVLSQPTLTQYQYQDWEATVYSEGRPAPTVNVQHDPAYLAQIGVIPNFNLANGVDLGLIQSEAQSIATSGWGAPLADNNVTMYMPTTGGRGDIGPTTQANAAWLISQDPSAASYALGQADTAGAVPWNMWVPYNQSYLNTALISDIWVDGRGGPGSYTTGLTQQVDTANSGWTPDPAHQPDLSYYAYMMTGDETYLDRLNAQASYTVTATWPVDRGSQQLVCNHEQVRAAAWSLREIDEASYANPTGSAEGQYFTQISDSNWKWLVAQIPAWTELQGQAYGQVEGVYGNGDGSKIAPWQQDYFASTAVQAAQHGNADALTFLKWESNYLVGRFLQGENGFNPRDGIVYNLNVAAGGIRFATWGQIEAATTAAGNSNGAGWEQSEGYYGELALQSLAGIITVTESADAIKAYNWLITSGAPFTSADVLAGDAQYDIVPKLPSGLTFAADGTIVTDVSAVPPSTTGSTTTFSGTTPTNSTTPTSNEGLVLNMSEDAYQGDAQFTITIDGKQVGDTYTTTASHASGATQAINLGTLANGPHQVGVTFVNDKWDGTSSTDRNLYLDNASYNGTSIAGGQATLLANGTATFTATADQLTATPVPPPTVPDPAPASSGLVLNMSEDAYQGDAQFTVTIDGKQVGDTYTTTASHASGATQAINLGTLANGPHQVGVTFVNDKWDGTSSTDRNLYLDNASYNGTSIAGGQATLLANGTATFTANVSRLSNAVINVSEDAYQGDAQFMVAVDGEQIGGTYTATASHAAGQSQDIFLTGITEDFTNHDLSVTFLNDMWGGTSSTDRNLYINSIQFDGQSVPAGSAALFTTGTQHFTALAPVNWAG